MVFLGIFILWSEWCQDHALQGSPSTLTTAQTGTPGLDGKWTGFTPPALTEKGLQQHPGLLSDAVYCVILAKLHYLAKLVSSMMKALE